MSYRPASEAATQPGGVAGVLSSLKPQQLHLALPNLKELGLKHELRTGVDADVNMGEGGLTPKRGREEASDDPCGDPPEGCKPGSTLEDYTLKDRFYETWNLDSDERRKKDLGLVSYHQITLNDVYTHKTKTYVQYRILLQHFDMSIPKMEEFKEAQLYKRLTEDVPVEGEDKVTPRFIQLKEEGGQTLPFFETFMGRLPDEVKVNNKSLPKVGKDYQSQSVTLRTDGVWNENVSFVRDPALKDLKALLTENAPDNFLDPDPSADPTVERDKKKVRDKILSAKRQWPKDMEGILFGTLEDWLKKISNEGGVIVPANVFSSQHPLENKTPKWCSLFLRLLREKVMRQIANMQGPGESNADVMQDLVETIKTSCDGINVTEAPAKAAQLRTAMLALANSNAVPTAEQKLGCYDDIFMDSFIQCKKAVQDKRVGGSDFYDRLTNSKERHEEVLCQLHLKCKSLTQAIDDRRKLAIQGAEIKKQRGEEAETKRQADNKKDAEEKRLLQEFPAILEEYKWAPSDEGDARPDPFGMVISEEGKEARLLRIQKLKETSKAAKRHGGDRGDVSAQADALIEAIGLIDKEKNLKKLIESLPALEVKLETIGCSTFYERLKDLLENKLEMQKTRPPSSKPPRAKKSLQEWAAVFREQLELDADNVDWQLLTQALKALAEEEVEEGNFDAKFAFASFDLKWETVEGHLRKAIEAAFAKQRGLLQTLKAKEQKPDTWPDDVKEAVGMKIFEDKPDRFSEQYKKCLLFVDEATQPMSAREWRTLTLLNQGREPAKRTQKDATVTEEELEPGSDEDEDEDDEKSSSRGSSPSPSPTEDSDDETIVDEQTDVKAGYLVKFGLKPEEGHNVFVKTSIEQEQKDADYGEALVWLAARNAFKVELQNEKMLQESTESKHILDRALKYRVSNSEILRLLRNLLTAKIRRMTAKVDQYVKDFESDAFTKKATEEAAKPLSELWELPKESGTVKKMLEMHAQKVKTLSNEMRDLEAAAKELKSTEGERVAALIRPKGQVDGVAPAMQKGEAEDLEQAKSDAKEMLGTALPFLRSAKTTWLRVFMYQHVHPNKKTKQAWTNMKDEAFAMLEYGLEPAVVKAYKNGADNDYWLQKSVYPELAARAYFDNSRGVRPPLPLLRADLKSLFENPKQQTDAFFDEWYARSKSWFKTYHEQWLLFSSEHALLDAMDNGSTFPDFVKEVRIQEEFNQKLPEAEAAGAPEEAAAMEVDAAAAAGAPEEAAAMEVDAADAAGAPEEAAAMEVEADTDPRVKKAKKHIDTFLQGELEKGLKKVAEDSMCLVWNLAGKKKAQSDDENGKEMPLLWSLWKQIAEIRDDIDNLKAPDKKGNTKPGKSTSPPPLEDEAPAPLPADGSASTPDSANDTNGETMKILVKKTGGSRSKTYEATEFFINSTEADGNCFFDAIRQGKEIGKTVQQLRDTFSDYIKDAANDETGNGVYQEVRYAFALAMSVSRDQLSDFENYVNLNYNATKLEKLRNQSVLSGKKKDLPQHADLKAWDEAAARLMGNYNAIAELSKTKDLLKRYADYSRIDKTWSGNLELNVAKNCFSARLCTLYDRQTAHGVVGDQLTLHCVGKKSDAVVYLYYENDNHFRFMTREPPPVGVRKRPVFTVYTPPPPKGKKAPALGAEPSQPASATTDSVKSKSKEELMQEKLKKEEEFKGRLKDLQYTDSNMENLRQATQKMHDVYKAKYKAALEAVGVWVKTQVDNWKEREELSAWDRAIQQLDEYRLAQFELRKKVLSDALNSLTFTKRTKLSSDEDNIVAQLDADVANKKKTQKAKADAAAAVNVIKSKIASDFANTAVDLAYALRQHDQSRMDAQQAFNEAVNANSDFSIWEPQWQEWDEKSGRTTPRQDEEGDGHQFLRFTPEQHAHFFLKAGHEYILKEDGSIVLNHPVQSSADPARNVVKGGGSQDLKKKDVEGTAPAVFNKPYAKHVLKQHLEDLQVLDERAKETAKNTKLGTCLGEDTDKSAEKLLPFFESMLRYRNTMIAAKLLLAEDQQALSKVQDGHEGFDLESKTRLGQYLIHPEFGIEGHRLILMSRGRLPDPMVPSQPHFLPLRIFAPPRVGKSATALMVATLARRVGMLCLYSVSPNKTIPISELKGKLNKLRFYVTPKNATRSGSNKPSSAAPPKPTLDEFDPESREWYEQALKEALAELEPNNPTAQRITKGRPRTVPDASPSTSEKNLQRNAWFSLVDSDVSWMKTPGAASFPYNQHIEEWGKKSSGEWEHTPFVDMVAYSSDNPITDVQNIGSMLGSLKFTDVIVFHIRDEAQSLAKDDKASETMGNPNDSPPPGTLMYLRHYYNNLFGLNCNVTATHFPTLLEEKMWGFLGSVTQNTYAGLEPMAPMADIAKRPGSTLLPNVVPALLPRRERGYTGTEKLVEWQGKHFTGQTTMRSSLDEEQRSGKKKLTSLAEHAENFENALKRFREEQAKDGAPAVDEKLIGQAEQLAIVSPGEIPGIIAFMKTKAEQKRAVGKQPRNAAEQKAYDEDLQKAADFFANQEYYTNHFLNWYQEPKPVKPISEYRKGEEQSKFQKQDENVNIVETYLSALNPQMKDDGMLGFVKHYAALAHDTWLGALQVPDRQEVDEWLQEHKDDIMEQFSFAMVLYVDERYHSYKELHAGFGGEGEQLMVDDKKRAKPPLLKGAASQAVVFYYNPMLEVNGDYPNANEEEQPTLDVYLTTDVNMAVTQKFAVGYRKFAILGYNKLKAGLTVQVEHKATINGKQQTYHFLPGYMALAHPPNSPLDTQWQIVGRTFSVLKENQAPSEFKIKLLSTKNRIQILKNYQVMEQWLAGDVHTDAELGQAKEEQHVPLYKALKVIFGGEELQNFGKIGQRQVNFSEVLALQAAKFDPDKDEPLEMDLKKMAAQLSASNETKLLEETPTTNAAPMELSKADGMPANVASDTPTPMQLETPLAQASFVRTSLRTMRTGPLLKK